MRLFDILYGSPVFRFLYDELLAIPVPQRVVLPSKKLGAVLRILQSILLIAILVYIVLQKVWLQDYMPTPWTTELWHLIGHTDRVNNADVLHCTDPSAYKPIPDTRLKSVPTHCERLGHNSVGAGPQGIFIPTYIEQNNSWQGRGSVCDAAAESWCNSLSVSAWSASDNDSCSCEWNDNFFAKNPEQDILLMRHGFQVLLADGQRRQQKVSIPGVLTGSGKRMDGNLVTIIEGRQSGQPCMIGGKSRWEQNVAAKGIGGTLADWLACGGIPSLDANPQTLEPGFDDTSLHLRTMGIVLEFHLDYQNDPDVHSVGVVCYLRVEALMQWTFQPGVVDRLELPSVGGGSFRTLRQRTMYGVAVKTDVTGAYKTFNYYNVIRTIIEMLVLWTIPYSIVQFLALYCMGFISELYRRARRTNFDLRTHAASALSKMMLASMGFRGMVGGNWTSSADNLPQVSHRGLYMLCQDLFHETRKEGVISDQELKSMATVSFQNMASVGKDGVSFSDFVRTYASKDIIDLQHMIRFFAREKGGIVEEILDGERLSIEHQCSESLDEWDENEPTRVMRRSLKMQEDGMSLVLRRLDALEENLDLEERIQKLEESDFVQRLSKLEATVGILEVKERPDKSNSGAMQSASKKVKDDACNEPKCMEVDDSAKTPRMEQLESKVQSLDLDFREMQAILRTLSGRSQQQPLHSSLKKDHQQGMQGLRENMNCLSQDLFAGLDHVNGRCSKLEEKLQQLPATTLPSSHQSDRPGSDTSDTSSVTEQALSLPRTYRASSEGAGKAIPVSRRSHSTNAGLSARASSLPRGQIRHASLLGDSLSPLAGTQGQLSVTSTFVGVDQGIRCTI